MPLFAATIFCGAFLLFLVQPLIGKYILPWFGGGPGVWTTCLLFFQTLLLGGYAYAHLLQRLAPRRQTLVHLALLAASLAFLPVIPSANWKPAAGGEPVGQILWLLTAVLGIPYLVLAATGPLIQRWFSLSHPGVSPYRLYALSNVGSLLALVAYPFFLEPYFSRRELGWGWSVGLVLFALLCFACIRRVRKIASADTPAETGTAPGKPASRFDRFQWVALPAVASILLVATTNKLCLDIAAVPFLWVLPLGVYLVTFIVCFDHPRWYRRGLFVALLALGCGLAVAFFDLREPALILQVTMLTGLLFVGGMVCHGELYRLRPPPQQLTGYYLCIAAGGAAGSLFVTLGAPLVFSDYRELQVGLVLLLALLGAVCFSQRSRAVVIGLASGAVAAVILVPLLRTERGNEWSGWFFSFGRELRALLSTQAFAIAGAAGVLVLGLFRGWRVKAEWRPRMAAVPLLLAGILATVFIQQAASNTHGVFQASRNFYGAFRVQLFDYAPDPTTHFFTLTNGGIDHGRQFRGGPQAQWPTTYYSETSGVGRAFAALPSRPRHIGAIGLGTGTIAAYGRPGDTIHFYEINPAIVGIASTTFTYLKESHATVSIALGDARLVMERELHDGPPQQFDLLVVDAFAGDAIPVHLLTREALALYRRQLRPDGIIAVHISNRHLDLRPVVEALAEDAGLSYLTVSDTVIQTRWWLYNTVWVLLSPDATILDRGPLAQVPRSAVGRRILWTDDHASLFEVVR